MNLDVVFSIVRLICNYLPILSTEILLFEQMSWLCWPRFGKLNGQGPVDVASVLHRCACWNGKWSGLKLEGTTWIIFLCVKTTNLVHTHGIDLDHRHMYSIAIWRLLVILRKIPSVLSYAMIIHKWMIFEYSGKLSRDRFENRCFALPSATSRGRPRLTF